MSIPPLPLIKALCVLSLGTEVRTIFFSSKVTLDVEVFYTFPLEPRSVHIGGLLPVADSFL